jgi:hypothetical protein
VAKHTSFWEVINGFDFSCQHATADGRVSTIVRKIL